MEKKLINIHSLQRNMEVLFKKYTFGKTINHVIVKKLFNKQCLLMSLDFAEILIIDFLI